ncbi:low molecular weight protein arginine phosphatase [Neobacillus mesonae]|uniref:low molecular weight protein arginine phosphatase n=1 Tax=Neobacillus mesonae TaxID=1193713 RepID=UPI00203E7FDC|nr:low molecular weight protein arginine phosphatase [Neobacillus mesonae]MCM3567201.1 low molecular weight protein arginine phosphatase [Neobacillus mesonae]
MKHILFVCTGNTCRSPMAAAILKSKEVDGIEVKSAGIFAASGSDASPHAKHVLENNQISYSHQSQPLTDREVEWADFILTMTGSHKAAIQQQYPKASEKVFTLKEFSGESADLDVIDPYGGSLKDYEDTFQELKKLIDEVIRKINS